MAVWSLDLIVISLQQHLRRVAPDASTGFTGRDRGALFIARLQLPDGASVARREVTKQVEALLEGWAMTTSSRSSASRCSTAATSQFVVHSDTHGSHSRILGDCRLGTGGHSDVRGRPRSTT